MLINENTLCYDVEDPISFLGIVPILTKDFAAAHTSYPVAVVSRSMQLAPYFVIQVHSYSYEW